MTSVVCGRMNLYGKNDLSVKLEKEKKERKIENRERQKEREENKEIMKGMKRFQNLLLSINNNDTNEEIIVKVKNIARKLKINEMK